MNSASHDTKRVLVVDDDLDTLEATKFLIELYSRNTVCDLASDVYEGLLALSNYRYDFILIDYRLPGLSGEMLLKKMDQQIEQDPLIQESGMFSKKVPVVIMSGHDDVALPRGFHLNHFQLMDVIRKRDLPGFLKKMKEEETMGTGLSIDLIWDFHRPPVGMLS